VVTYRSFRNNDPPALVEIWNEALGGRGSVRLRNSSPLERFVFAKPYFDPDGLIVAEEGGVRVGFAHAAFGANDQESDLDRTSGVICLLAVRPSYRRRGIGSELLRRSEEYLRKAGAQSIFAGPMRPLNPFYLALYGGSEMPGFLESDQEAGPFLTRHGYRPWDNCLVFHRKLDQPINVADGRFPGIRRRYEVRALPQIPIGTWWQECVLGPLEPVEFRLEEIESGHPVARAAAWEMEGFSWRWNQPSVGVVDLAVREDLRRQGLAKFLLAQILRYLKDQYFGIVEIQTMERNEPAVKLYRGLGFEQVDIGHVYRREADVS
jgi:ribosomal protein S18 acetylase RimI-like enzyme